jgi:RNA polymerase sigma-54 factor
MQNLSISQNLNQKLSPQQIQFMKLLQVSSSNIEGIIKKELEANPALEEESNDLSIENESNIDDFKLDQESYKTKSSFNSENKNSEIPFSVGSSLNEKLLDQLSYLKLNEKEQIIAKQIIGTIDEDGYLRRDTESIIDDIAFTESLELQIKEVENVVKLIQSFDPPGIGARNLKECLIIQLNNIEKKNKEELVALNIINNFYDDFINKHYDKII